MRHLVNCWAYPASLVFLAAAGADVRAGAIDFNRDIRPILSKNCFACHGPDKSHRASKMRLDERASAIAPLRSGGAALVPGKPDASEVMRRVTATDEAEHMPPPETGNKLTAKQIATLRQWIAEGARYAEHWAWVKPVRHEYPPVKDTRWPKNGIDYFVLARLEAEGLRPSADADRFALLRRASLDLRGLPPTLAEVEQFAQDASPNAYEKAVDRFLMDPAFGERWARMWLDLARYADSAGYGSDPLRPHMSRYRDWVIEAFNRNLPFDQFSIEQLAGDLLPHPNLQQRIATAFHRNTMTNTEGGTDDEEYRVAAVKDRVDVTMQAWMGLTMGCAKCHNHKYDPLTQQDYYRLYAFFNQTADNDQPDESPTIELPTPEVLAERKVIDDRIAAIKGKLRQPTKVNLALRVWRRVAPLPEDLLDRVEIARLTKSRPAVPALPIMVELPADKKRETHVLVKGNYLTPGDKVEPGMPAVFTAWMNNSGAASFPSSAHGNGAPSRLDVARWLFHPENPLTARVAVNRFWAQLWGAGIVETEEDFGTQGSLPSHPELLDWLATEYVRLGWDTKALLRLMVTSATYRQTSLVTPELLRRDPRNRLLTRGPRFRLEAEMVRDQALAISGLLSRKVGGPSVYPPQPAGLWQAAFNGQRNWATSTGEDRYRRGLYTFWRRTVPYPSMATFDAPSRETCTVRRSRTNTPLQAFVTMNDPVYVEAAQALARRILREAGSSTYDRAAYGLKLALARPPQGQQVQRLIALYTAELEHYRRDRQAAVALATDPLGPLPAGADPAELATWTVIGNVLLNMDAVLSKS